jgi:hypothetical protein
MHSSIHPLLLTGTHLETAFSSPAVGHLELTSPSLDPSSACLLPGVLRCYHDVHRGQCDTWRVQVGVLPDRSCQQRGCPPDGHARCRLLHDDQGSARFRRWNGMLDVLTHTLSIYLSVCLCLSLSLSHTHSLTSPALTIVHLCVNMFVHLCACVCACAFGCA